MPKLLLAFSYIARVTPGVEGGGEGEEEEREEERREWKDEGAGERRAREMKNGDETGGIGRSG